MHRGAIRFTQAGDDSNASSHMSARDANICELTRLGCSEAERIQRGVLRLSMCTMTGYLRQGQLMLTESEDTDLAIQTHR